MSSGAIKSAPREQVAALYKAFSALPVKGDGFIKCAVNMLALRPIVDVSDISKKKVMESAVGAGVNTIECAHPKFGEIVAAIQKIDDEVVDLPPMQKLSKSEIRISDNSPDGVQNLIVTLVLHDLLSME